MFMPVEKAAETLAVTAPYLTRRMRASQKTIMREGIAYVRFLEAAQTVGCAIPLAEKVVEGKDWLMTDFQIRNIFNLTAQQVKNIAGGPVFIADGQHIYNITPFIEFFKLDPREQAAIKEG